jgi:hypothetical protein
MRANNCIDAHRDNLRLELVASLPYVGNGMEAHTDAGERKLGGQIDSRQAWLIAMAVLLMPSISFGAPYVAIVALKLPISAATGRSPRLRPRWPFSARASAVWPWAG